MIHTHLYDLPRQVEHGPGCSAQEAAQPGARPTADRPHFRHLVLAVNSQPLVALRSLVQLDFPFSLVVHDPRKSVLLVNTQSVHEL